MIRSVRTVACAAAVAIGAAGCSTMTRTDCAVVGGLAGATIGGVGGAVAVNNLEATPSDWERAAGAGGGGVAGGLIGALIGWNVCHEPEPAPVAAPPPPPPPSGTEIAEIRGTHFAFDSAKLTSEGETILDEAISVMNRNPGINVHIDGHTDSVGSEAYNMQLGQRRADSARDYLVSQGISSSRITTRSLGESMPAASNDTASGRAENRRVEIIVE
jgi:outer membrane protein OmpA-like peptidoglycan-associated protein